MLSEHHLRAMIMLQHDPDVIMMSEGRQRQPPLGMQNQLPTNAAKPVSPMTGEL